MASDGSPGQIPVAGLVQGSQATVLNSAQLGGGKALPPSNVPAAVKSTAAGNTAAAADAARKVQQQRSTDPQAAVSSLNKYLNDSGRADQFRVDPGSGNKLIQQINPANGVVLGQYSVDEFPELARSIGASGLIVDSLV